ncbi:hypothetical protein [Notoacmeibacter marinus]|uniref:hypothetical protein n=1 Tax=Notoacmeibacter marinus TaxID=1876515 RepID=UPI001FE07632|nr:hypothetical protein [Notoacmeibacter marinus]
MKTIGNLILMLALSVAFAPASALAARCTDYANCRQAVENWCAGRHARADGDNDGIPCENVCTSRAEVQAIMAEIGCAR